MDIIIAGAGRVGFRLARALSEKHNVILIDSNENALDKIQESLDVLTISGNVEDPKSYQSLEHKNIDIFVAVTDMDETNLISSIIASEKINVQQKIIRLKQEFFAKSSIAKKIGITDAVFPYNQTAKGIVSLLNYPKANNVKSFPNTKNKLISIRIDNDLHGFSTHTINSKKINVVGIDSGKKLIIPSGYEKLKTNDMVYLFGDEVEIEKISHLLNSSMPKKIKNIAIFGADILGIEIAKTLLENGAKVKIIEKDLNKCNIASETLQNDVTIINSKYGDFRLYNEEGLKNADMIIASTSNDEENIIKCIEAKSQGVSKVIAINNDIEYYKLMHTLGVIVVRGPKTNAFYSIMEIIGSNKVVNEKLFCGGTGISFIKDVTGGTTLFPLNMQGVICFVLIDDQCEPFKHKMLIEKNGQLIVFAMLEKEDEVRRWINKL